MKTKELFGEKLLLNKATPQKESSVEEGLLKKTDWYVLVFTIKKHSIKIKTRTTGNLIKTTLKNSLGYFSMFSSKKCIF